ncbi:TetR/AcrR family transcriptional regulator [Nocardia jiangxiensis]|uniref:TetR/AcrR family transcriptional regulator n=1 Tax=Nocardia jiangxiensis TaxID=282685 RepID=A0ABW6S7Y7_9NOCA|nr:TetR/AcrR family transcriptional regulator [Nocardia jiangxiensis]
MARTRDTRLDAAIRTAVVELLDEQGYEQLTIGAVASRAGVHRPAVYRRWPSKRHLVVDAVAELMGVTPTPNTGDLRSDLLEGMSTLVRSLSSTPLGRALPALVADLSASAELSDEFRSRVFLPRRESSAAALRSAIERGEIRADFDMDFVLDLLAAPLYYRVLFGHQPLTPRLAEQTVDAVLTTISTQAVEPSGYQRNSTVLPSGSAT